MLYIYQNRRKYFKIEQGCSAPFCLTLKELYGPDVCFMASHVQLAISRDDAEAGLDRVPEGCKNTVSDLRAAIERRFPSSPQTPA